MIDKVTGLKEAMGVIKSGDSFMIGGFTLSGCPLELLRYLASMPVSGLTAISEDMGYANDTVYDEAVVGLLENGQIRKVIVSFLGNNKRVHALINEGRLDYELVPQGTLAERIRCGGTGLGGVLTPTGIGTVVEQGKRKIEVNGREYLLEEPLHADVALVKAHRADRLGNGVFRYTARNFNGLMAMAADKTVLLVEEIVEPGQIEPDEVQLPGIFVDHVVLSEEGRA